MDQPRRLLLAAAVALLASACATQRIPVKPDFWQDRQARVGVALTTRPEVAAHKVGAQGLLDMAINAGMAADLKAHLLTVDVSAFDRVRDRFVEELRKRGMIAVALPGYLDPAKYPERPADAPKVENAYERDLSTLRAEQKLDAVVLLQVRRFGTIRSYYGFVPLNAPSGFFEAMGQMVDLRTGGLTWQTVMPEQASSVPSDGDWDQPPSYPNLSAALRAAVAKGDDFLWREFFFPEGVPATPATPAAQAPVAAAQAAPPAQP
jgi:hypothetical protein